MASNICPRCGFPNDPGVTTCRKCRLAYSDSKADRGSVDIYGSPAPSVAGKPGKAESSDPPDPNATLPLMPGDHPDTSYMVIPRTKTSPKAVVVPVTGEKPSSAPPGKTGLDFSDEAPPGQAPVSVASGLSRELPSEGRISRVAAPIAAPAPERQEAPERPLRSMDLPRSKGIRITMPEEPAAAPGTQEKAEPTEMGTARDFSDAGPGAPSAVHKAAPHPSRQPGAEAARPSAAAKVSLPGIAVRESWIEYSEPLVKRDVVAAGFIRRGTAAAVDTALVVGAAAGVAWLGLASFGMNPALQAALNDTGKAVPALGLPIALLLAAVVGLYSLAFHFLSGKTIGKMVLGLRVITMDGSPLTIWRAAGRTAAYAATLITFFIGFLWILVDDRGQALHDKISGTYVIIEGE